MTSRTFWSRLLLVIGCITLACAIGLIIAAGVIGFKRRQFVSGAAPAEAVVVEMTSIAGENSEVWAPVLSYVDSSGAEHRLKGSVWVNPPSYRIGDKVAVLVSRTDPEMARINSFTDLWLLPAVLGGAALPDLVLGVGLLLAARYVARRPAPTPH